MDGDERMRARKSLESVLLGSFIAAMLFLPVAHALPELRAEPAAESFAAFWTRFKTALARNDRSAIASMTKHCKCGQMPFENDEQFLDEWYEPVRRNRRCLARAKPVAHTSEGKQSYSVICRDDGDELVFERIGNEWKFVNVNLAP